MNRFKPLVVYILLAFFISWITFIPLALNHHQIIFLFPDDEAHARELDVWHSLGGLGPLLGALITLGLFYTKKERSSFRNGYSFRKLHATGWILSLSPLLLFAISLPISRLINDRWMDIPGFFQSNELTNPTNLFAWFLPMLFYGFGEEAGWRGYALPVLQNRYSAFRATLIISVIWACWHIPSFFYRYDLKGMAFAGFIAGIFAGAIWLTFLFNYTKGSILAVSLWHLSFNLVSMVAKDEEVLSAVMSTGVMLLAAFVLFRYRTRELSPVIRTSLPTDIGEKTSFEREKVKSVRLAATNKDVQAP